jgi:hypothetical protein
MSRALLGLGLGSIVYPVPHVLEFALLDTAVDYVKGHQLSNELNVAILGSTPKLEDFASPLHNT